MAKEKRAQRTKMKCCGLDLHIDTEQAVFNHSHLLTPLSYLAIIIWVARCSEDHFLCSFSCYIVFVSIVRIIVSMYFGILIHAKHAVFCCILLFTLKHLLIHTFMFSLFAPFVLLLSLPLSQCLLSFCNVACETGVIINQSSSRNDSTVAAQTLLSSSQHQLLETVQGSYDVPRWQRIVFFEKTDQATNKCCYPLCNSQHKKIF